MGNRRINTGEGECLKDLHSRIQIQLKLTRLLQVYIIISLNLIQSLRYKYCNPCFYSRVSKPSAVSFLLQGGEKVNILGT